MRTELSIRRPNSQKHRFFRPLEALEIRRLFSIFTVSNINDTGTGSLHDAIIQANLSPAKDTIAFGLPSGERTIRLISSLPRITDPVVIDGTTQAGFRAAPLVKIRAPFFGGIGPGNVFHLSAGDSTIRGLCITAAATAIRIDTNGGNKITGNYIGTDLTGMLDEGNRVGISISSNNNTIGGATAAERNIISASALDGIVLAGSGNTITNNYIGTDVTGTSALGNALRGISLEGAGRNSITSNLIAANAGGGVRLVGPSRNNVLHGNKIGTDASGRFDLGNGGHGVYIAVDQGAAQNTVGGAAAGQGNLVAFNRQSGVVVAGHSTRNTIRGNRIFSNAGMALDIGDDGTNLNDAGDADTGPNSHLNYPVLTGAFTNLGRTLVEGTYHGAPDSTFTLDFYSTATTDSSGHGGAQAYLGSTTITTDASGNARFSSNLRGDVPLRHKVSATATDAAGNTSEFSVNSAIRFARLSAGRLAITGTAGNDAVAISVNGSRLRVSLNGVLVQFSKSSITAITVTLGDGNDAMTTGVGVIGINVDGGRGNDSLTGGDGKDRILGGPGNDLLDGAGAEDVLYGGAGNDRLLGNLGRDKLYGGDGNDTLFGGQAADTINGDAGPDAWRPDPLDRFFSVERRV